METYRALAIRGGVIERIWVEATVGNLGTRRLCVAQHFPETASILGLSRETKTQTNDGQRLKLVLLHDVQVHTHLGVRLGTHL